MAKRKEWKEAELILTFGLIKKQVYEPVPLMLEWQNIENPAFDALEQHFLMNCSKKILRVSMVGVKKTSK
jgi:hypothetical protein